MRFLDGRFRRFTGFGGEQNAANGPAGLFTSQLGDSCAPLQSVYMRCINVFRNGALLMRDWEGDSIQNESANTGFRVHVAVPAVYDGPQETTGSWNLHCK